MGQVSERRLAAYGNLTLEQKPARKHRNIGQSPQPAIKSDCEKAQEAARPTRHVKKDAFEALTWSLAKP